MSDFKTKFFARLNELADKHKHQPTKYYIIRTFDDSDWDGVGDCIFTATNRYELWLKVHNYIMSKYPYGEGLYLEDWIEEVKNDCLYKYGESDEEESIPKESKKSKESNPKKSEEEVDMLKLVNASIKSVMDSFENGDTEWFEEFTKLI